LLVESVGTSIVVGKLRGGSLSNIKDASLEKWYFFVSGFLVEFAAVYMASKGAAFFRENILFIHGLSYMLLFIGIYFNRSILAFRIVFPELYCNNGKRRADAGFGRSNGSYRIDRQYA